MPNHIPKEGNELKGANGRVYVLKRKIDDLYEVWTATQDGAQQTEFVIKFFKNEHDSLFEQEKYILQKLSARQFRVPRYITSSPKPDRARYVIMTFLGAKSLLDIINDSISTKQSISEGMAVRIILQILPTLAYLHMLGYAYLDLRPENVLWDDNNKQAWLVDFGSAKEFGSADGTEDWKSSPYAAPELKDRKLADRRCDIFSAAFILLELLAIPHPVRKTAPGDPLRYVKNDELKKLIDRAANRDLDKRPGSILDFALDLYRFVETSEPALITTIIQASQPNTKNGDRRTLMLYGFCLFMVALVVLVGVVAIWNCPKKSAAPTVTLTVPSQDVTMLTTVTGSVQGSSSATEDASAPSASAVTTSATETSSVQGSPSATEDASVPSASAVTTCDCSKICKSPQICARPTICPKKPCFPGTPGCQD